MLLHQLAMAADLDDLPVFQHHDLVGHGGTGQPVGHEDGGLVLAQGVELVVDLLLGNGVQRGSGFV